MSQCTYLVCQFSGAAAMVVGQLFVVRWWVWVDWMFGVAVVFGERAGSHLRHSHVGGDIHPHPSLHRGGAMGGIEKTLYIYLPWKRPTLHVFKKEICLHNGK